MIKNYRISVDGQFYTGEKDCTLSTFETKPHPYPAPAQFTNDPWSGNTFNVKRIDRNILTFEPKENNHFKTITGRICLLGEIKRIIEFISYTGLMAGDEIIIEAEPYKVPIELNIDYFLSLESELSKQKAINQEMKSQLDIATDLGQKRFEKIVELEAENKELAYDKMNLMQYYLGNDNLRLVIISLLAKESVICDDCGGSGGVEIGENETDTCAKCGGKGIVLKHNDKYNF